MYRVVDSRQVDCMTVAYIAKCDGCDKLFTAVSSTGKMAHRLLRRKALAHYRRTHLTQKDDK